MKVLLKLFTLCIIAYVLTCSRAELPFGVSTYVRIRYYARSNTFLCGNLICQARAYGCGITLKNNPLDKAALSHNISCFDESNDVIAFLNRQLIPDVKKDIDIDIRTMRNASTEFESGYSRKMEKLQGTVSPSNGEAIINATITNVYAVEKFNVTDCAYSFYNQSDAPAPRSCF